MAEEVINALWTKGVLVSLNIGKSQFNKRVSDDDVGFKRNKEAMSGSSKVLMPARVIKKLSNLEHLARATLYVRSVEFPLSGARFVYYSTIEEVTKSLESIRTQWNAAVLEITANYEALKEEQIKVLDDQSMEIAGNRTFQTEADKKSWLESQYHRNRNIFPPLASIQDRFKFGWHMYKVNAIDGLSTMNAMEKDTILNAQKQLHQEMQDWVKGAAAEVHQKLGEAAANASAMLAKQGKLNPKNLKPLFDAFEQFKALDFTGSSDFRNKVDQVIKKFKVVSSDGVTDLVTSANAVNTTGAGMTQFKEVLDDLSELAVDAVAEEAGLRALHKVGEFKRMVEV